MLNNVASARGEQVVLLLFVPAARAAHGAAGLRALALGLPWPLVQIHGGLKGDSTPTLRFLWGLGRPGVLAPYWEAAWRAAGTVSRHHRVFDEKSRSHRLVGGGREETTARKRAG